MLRHTTIAAALLLGACQTPQPLGPIMPLGPSFTGGLAVLPSGPWGDDPQITVDDDPYERQIVLSTSPIEVRNGSHTMLWSLLAYVDRQTRQVTAVTVHFSDVYTARDWAFWSRATGLDGLSYEVLTVHRDVHSCGHINGCIYSETLIAELPSMPAAGAEFSFKASTRTGADQVARFPAAVIDAMHGAVDRAGP